MVLSTPLSLETLWWLLPLTSANLRRYYRPERINMSVTRGATFPTITSCRCCELLCETRGDTPARFHSLIRQREITTNIYYTYARAVRARAKRLADSDGATDGT